MERRADLRLAPNAADDGGQFDDAVSALGAPAAAKKKFVLVPFSDIQFVTEGLWLVKGLLPASGVATVFGPPKQYKSFIALDLGLHVAAGWPWAGRRVKQGAVVYIACEGSIGFQNRVAANRQRGDYPYDLPFYVIAARPNLGVGKGDSEELAAAIDAELSGRGLSVVMIVIDTLVRTLCGASENDEGMRNFTDNGEILSERFECLVVPVHHVGKDASRGMRGSSAIDGAVTAAWKVEKQRDFEARVTLEYAKDGESGLTWPVTLERYVYATDKDGDDLSALVVSEVGEPVPECKAASSSAVSASAPNVPPLLRLFISCLEAAMAAAGRPARPFADGPEIRVVPLRLIRDEYFSRRGDEATDDAKRKSFEHNQKIGVERQLILIAAVDGEKVVWKAKTDP